MRIRKYPWFLAWALLLTGSTAAMGQAPLPPSPGPPADVVARLAQLEAETQALRQEVQTLRERPTPLPPVGVTPVGMAQPPAAAPSAGPAIAPPAGADNQPLAASPPQAQLTTDEIRNEMRKFAWTKGDFTIVPYGYLWGNTVYSTERTSPGSYTLYALSASTGPESECIVDARNTRLGFDVSGPKIPWLDDAVTGGKVEIDFQQTVLSTENKPSVLLRHAYFDVKNDEFRLLVGQTWDVISPLYPGMLMYSVGWDAGDIGYRRAQVRGERDFALSDVSLVTAQLSINQIVDPDTTTLIKGESSGWPLIEGRAAWTVGHRGPDCLPITIGVSGHIGDEEFDYSTNQFNDHRRTWSGNIDLRVPITHRLGFQGECQVGENLSPFLGGIGQGIDPTTLRTIRDAGGWFEFWYDWTPTLHSHVGYSVDDPNDHDLATTGERKYNQFYFGNLTFDVTKNFLVGVEVSSWRTLYVNELPGDSLRCEFVAKYGF